MVNSDSTDINSLIDYISNIKPYHSKLRGVTVRYEHNDPVNVKTDDTHTIQAHNSSVWTIDTLSNGVTNRFRLPAAVFARMSQKGSPRTWRLEGIKDTVDGSTTSYRIPYNNGVDVRVNGVLLEENIHYTMFSPNNHTVRFLPGHEPAIGDIIDLDLITIDRLYITIDGVGAHMDVSGFDRERERFDPFTDAFFDNGFDVRTYDTVGLEDGENILLQDENQTFLAAGGALFEGVRLGAPVARVEVTKDDTGGRLYHLIFSQDIFERLLPLGTRLQVRLEQDDTYNGYTRTFFSESVTFKDMFRFADAIRAHYTENAAVPVGFDDTLLDINPFDRLTRPHDWINIREKKEINFSTDIEDAEPTVRYLEHPKDTVLVGTSDAHHTRLNTNLKETLATDIEDNTISGYETTPFGDDFFDFVFTPVKENENQSQNIRARLTETIDFQITE